MPIVYSKSVAMGFFIWNKQSEQTIQPGTPCLAHGVFCLKTEQDFFWAFSSEEQALRLLYHFLDSI